MVMMEMSKIWLSQEEIDLLLKATDEADEDHGIDETITETEKDALGEIGNISMGTAATTLSTLLNRKVLITTPSDYSNYYWRIILWISNSICCSWC